MIKLGQNGYVDVEVSRSKEFVEWCREIGINVKLDVKSIAINSFISGSSQ